MNTYKKFAAAALLSAAALVSGAASASLYSYTGVVTLCTGTCDSFASLAVGTVITGLVEIDTTPGSSFADADITDFSFQVFNPALPVDGPTGNPVTDNPLVIDVALGIASSNGTTGTTDASNNINGGQMQLEFLIPPFSSNGAFMLFDLSTGNGQVCLFFSSAGCIPGATQAMAFEGEFTLVPVPGAAWLFGSALLGFLGFGRRT